jgi:transcriptional regulator with XRE-family HTH domain
MATTVAKPSLNVPRKMLALRGEALRKPLADDEMRRLIGGAIEWALSYAGLTKQQAADRMGYGSNQAPISRWISGLETPQLAKLWTLGDEFQNGLLIAMSRICRRRTVRVRTVISLSERLG